jgi:hypothetical protein
MKLDDCVKLHLEVGEGTNESIDLDKFDQYYHHLSYGTMMKKNCRSISNGIRLRNLSKHGIEGFYLNELFVLPELDDMMPNL